MKYLRLLILSFASLIIIPFSSCESEDDYIDDKLVGSWYMEHYFEGYKIIEFTFYKNGKFKEHLYYKYTNESAIANGTYKCSGYFLEIFYDYNENYVYRYDVTGDKLYIAGTDGTISLTRK